jgi:hypothetical protein
LAAAGKPVGSQHIAEAWDAALAPIREALEAP